MPAGKRCPPFQPHLRRHLRKRRFALTPGGCDVRTRTHRSAPGGTDRLRCLPACARSVGSRTQRRDAPRDRCLGADDRGPAGGGATNRGVETSVREAFNLDLSSVVVRECCWSGDAAAHAYSLDKAMKMYARIRRLDQVTAMLRE